ERIVGRREVTRSVVADQDHAVASDLRVECRQAVRLARRSTHVDVVLEVELRDFGFGPVAIEDADVVHRTRDCPPVRSNARILEPAERRLVRTWVPRDVRGLRLDRECRVVTRLEREQERADRLMEALARLPQTNRVEALRASVARER